MAKIKYSRQYTLTPWIRAHGGLSTKDKIFSLHARIIDMGDKEWKRISITTPSKDLILSR